MWIHTVAGLLVVLALAFFIAYLLSPDIEEWCQDWLEGARGWMGQVRVDHVTLPHSHAHHNHNHTRPNTHTHAFLPCIDDTGHSAEEEDPAMLALYEIGACDQLELSTSLRPRRIVDRRKAHRMRRLHTVWPKLYPGERLHCDPLDPHAARVLRQEHGRDVCMVLCV
jgi:hypothetical protein